MAYLGREISFGSFEKQTFATNGADTAFNLNFPAPREEALLLVKDGVVQKPGTAYTLSNGGVTINIAGGALASSIDLYCVYLGKELTVQNVTDNSITHNKLSTPIRQSVKTDTTVIATNTNLVATRHYFVDTTLGSITVTFPASPSLGDTIYVSDAYGTWDTNNCIVNPNGEKINGATGNSTLSSEYDSKEYIYIGGTAGWRTV